MRKKLADSILFSGLDDSDLALIEKTGNAVEVDKGQMIVFQGDPGEHFYLVLSGKVKVYKNSPDGKEQILLIAGPGDTFGEAALFAQTAFPANAEAIEAGTLLSFSRDRFLGLIRQKPDLAINMIARLSMLLHHLTRLVQHLSLEDISTRLAGYIIELIPETETRDALTIILQEKKMILASILGTIPETLSRAFAKLSKLGLISVEGQEVTIKSRSKLAEFASGQKN